MSEAHQLVTAVRQAIDAAGDPVRAGHQQAYMKSTLPFQGLSAPELRAVLRPVLADHRVDTEGAWHRAARALWDDAEVREHWYATIALLRHRAYSQWVRPDLVPLLRHLVVTGAWWDVVDEIASHLVGDVLAKDREQMTPLMRQWARADHLWLRRTAVLSQVAHKGTADPVLLEDVLTANLEGSPFGSEFFIRKAVGWALRERARTDPAWVREFVAAHEQHLSPLSRREALKHLS